MGSAEIVSSPTTELKKISSSKLYYQLDADRVIETLETNAERGLTSDQCRKRHEENGPNMLAAGDSVSISKIILKQICNAMVLVLILGLAVSLAIKSWIESAVIGAVIVLNIIVGFMQEYSAEKTMESLRSLSSPTAVVVRDGKIESIASKDVVVGDIVEIKMGDVIPADLRLCECMNFETDEALLTGESLPVTKTVDTIPIDECPVGDRINMAYSSSTVTKGRAKGVVIATGMATEIGMIAQSLRGNQKYVREVKTDSKGVSRPHHYFVAGTLTTMDMIGRFAGVNIGTPLQRKLSKLAILLFFIAVVFAIVVMAANNFQNKSEVIIYAVATGLSMIPASLVVVLTITMAMGTKRMAKRHVIVRKLDALEALGAVTDICSDKTGTLTQGKMVLRKCWVVGKGTFTVEENSEPFNPEEGGITFAKTEPSDLALKKSEPKYANATDYLDNDTMTNFLNVASLANLAEVLKRDGEWETRGDPTEIAIQVFAMRFNWGRKKLKSEGWKQVSEYPFDSIVKRMSVIFENKGKRVLFTKGAVERVLEACDNTYDAIQLDDSSRKRILKNMETFAKEGLRVLALASRTYEETSVPDDRTKVEQRLTFLGLVGLYDPPRPESADAVRQCHTAGINVHMLTGDHPETARAIASQVGIIPKDMSQMAPDIISAIVMTGQHFDRMNDAQIDELPVLPLVIARCAPQTKVRMIEALHRRGKYCAMTGDGVNDSPSLKRADVGVAMGMSGSDVAKDASDIVLTDDNFASILNAIEEGRRMFDNIQKFILHLLAQNIAQACTLLIGLAFKDISTLSVFPLSPVEILWIIMVTSGLPAMGLGMEHAAPDTMLRPPHDLKKGVFSTEVMVDMLVYGFWTAALCLCSFTAVAFGYGDGNLGEGCNSSSGINCNNVFRARATTFTSLTWFSLFLAWEMVNMRRSFFRMQPKTKHPWTQWLRDVWRNKFLFWTIIAGFITIFPLIYIPVINDVVFLHDPISWEWGIVFAEAIAFFCGVELWKWLKRAYYRRKGPEVHNPEEDITSRVFSRAWNNMIQEG